MSERPHLVTVQPEPEPVRSHAPTLIVWRCPTCGRILAKLRLTAGSLVEIKCGVCNTFAVREVA